MHVRKEPVKVTLTSPVVLKLTPLTSISVEVGMDAEGPKSYSNELPIGPLTVPSKSKLLSVMHNSSI